MHQETWVHAHLRALSFVFDRGWRRLSRQWCVHQLFAGRFQDHGAYRRWRVNLHSDRRRRRDGAAHSLQFTTAGRRLHVDDVGALACRDACGSIKLEQDGLSPMHEPSTGHLYSYVSDKMLATRLSSNNN